MAVKIIEVNPDGPAFAAGIRPGETLISMNGHEIVDILDYRFHETNQHLAVEVEDPAGKRREVTIRKGEYESIGLEFETYLMDKQHSCRNKCIFCFIDQLPKGMRETLYFKDDDSRLSFLFGNYITLTNLSEHEISRIIEMHISPINVSVHTTNPELRVKMMRRGRTAPHAFRFGIHVPVCAEYRGRPGRSDVPPAGAVPAAPVPKGRGCRGDRSHQYFF